MFDQSPNDSPKDDYKIDRHRLDEEPDQAGGFPGEVQGDSKRTPEPSPEKAVECCGDHQPAKPLARPEPLTRLREGEFGGEQERWNHSQGKHVRREHKEELLHVGKSGLHRGTEPLPHHVYRRVGEGCQNAQNGRFRSDMVPVFPEMVPRQGDAQEESEKVGRCDFAHIGGIDGMPGEIEHIGRDEAGKDLNPDTCLSSETVMQQHPAPEAQQRYDEHRGQPGPTYGQPADRAENPGQDRHDTGTPGKEHGGVSEGSRVGWFHIIMCCRCRWFHHSAIPAGLCQRAAEYTFLS